MYGRDTPSKYRKHILIDAVEKKLKKLLHQKIQLLGLEIGAIECMPNHIHLFIRSNTNLTISFIVKMLKGYTSRMLRKEFVHLNKYTQLWAHGYFCETIGNINERTVLRYIKNQKNV